MIALWPVLTSRPLKNTQDQDQDFGIKVLRQDKGMQYVLLMGNTVKHTKHMMYFSLFSVSRDWDPIECCWFIGWLVVGH